MGPVRQQKRRRLAGFTLIELLVVVAILGILLGTAVISFDVGGDQRAMQAYAQRLAQRIELARDRAIQNNQEWGMQVRAETYVFVAFAEYQAQWLPQHQSPFQPDTPPVPVTFRLEVLEGRGALNTGIFAQSANDDDDAEQVLPDLVFFSSGEASQFAIEILPADAPGDSNVSMRLGTDGFRAVSLHNDDAHDSDSSKNSTADWGRAGF